METHQEGPNNTSAEVLVTESGDPHVTAAAYKACKRIATGGTPGIQIGPNHCLEHSTLEFSDAASIMSDVGAARMTMPRRWYAQLVDAGTITAADIADALKESLSDQIEWVTVDDIRQHARMPDTPRLPLPTIAHLASVPGIDDLAGFVTERIAVWTTATLAANDAGTQIDRQTRSIYQAWQQDSALDATADNAGLTGMKQQVASFPATAEALLATAVNQLGLHLPGLANWFHRLLASIKFDSLWKAGLHDQQKPTRISEQLLLGMLAIRVGWDLALFRLLREKSSLDSVWAQARELLRTRTHRDPRMAMDCILQTAYEKSWQRHFMRRLCSNRPAALCSPAAIQAVFCSDPASESCRRALEQCSPLIETVGTDGLTATQTNTLPLQSGTEAPLARLVLLVGHAPPAGITPHSCASVCPTCGDHDGEASTRSAARRLNDGEMRTMLAKRGAAIPTDTLFVAALHQPVTGNLVLLDADKVPPSHRPDLDQLKLWLQQAHAVLRAEHTAQAGLFRNVMQSLMALGKAKPPLHDRSGGAVVSAFIAAPRSMTREINFGGSVYLHSYHSGHDKGFRILEQIMTTSMLAASAVNLQDYSARVNGSFSRNDERTLQEPVRLSVLLAAPIAEIDVVIGRHSAIGDLVNHDWIHIFAISSCGRKFLRRFAMGGWTLFRCESMIIEA